MTFDEYQKFAKTTAIYPENCKITYPTLGLCGESGEVAEKVKKKIRDGKPLILKDVVKDNVIVSKWYIAVHWGTENPYQDEFQLRIILERFKNLINNKIYIAPEHLRVN